MATKKRSTKKSATRKKTHKKSSFPGKFFRFIFSPPVMVFVLIVIIAGLIYWFSPAIIRWSSRSWESLVDTFGIVLALIVISLITIIALCVQ